MSMKLAKERESRVLGISSTGFPIFPFCGAEGEDDENGTKNSTDGGSGDGGSGGGDGGEGDPSGDGTGNEPPKTYTPEEYLALERRLRAADEAKGKMEKRLNEIDQATLSETEKLKKDLERANERIAALDKEKTEAKMANAILQYPGFTWHDPEVVLRVIDMDLIEMDEETGKIKGVKAALDKLAKEKPYLLKGKTSSGSGGGNDGGTNGAGGKVGSSGHNPGGDRADDKNARRKELAKKYKL